ncbi:unnamed protein product [Penicillium salamii]|uniref:FAS1 domain-containing protein n=1 Tax=Penicillium salamii TaxID=1612424 RepID=A0A9W4J0G0_9EURO|nr:unnamed protein product [Penicillium salamii]CAG8366224.1 unnamed protein product [Penicillium salamii]CAG8386716.1 unnamed protein product [Penicillium salamii]CAG8389065.1 unnamed protein product [Penicillium salamii]
MRSLLFLTITSLASALVIPDEDPGIRSQEQFLNRDEVDIGSWGAGNLKDQLFMDIPSPTPVDRGFGHGREWSRGHHDRYEGCPWDGSHGSWPEEGRHRHDWLDERPGWGRGHHESPGRHGEHGEWPGKGHRHGPDGPEDWPGHEDEGYHPPYFHHPHPHPYPGDRPCGGKHRIQDPCPGPGSPKDHTIWETIQQNEQTTRLAELISNDKELIELLSQKENHTIFAPTNHALSQLDLPANVLSNFLRYHIVPGRFHLHELALHQTLPTKLTEESLGKLPQRLVIDLVDEAILNRRSIVLRADISTKNGVIHIIDLPLHLPLETRAMIPEESIFARALAQTQLSQYMDPAHRRGGTTFVPTDRAFRRLGRRANEFLFSEEGAACLRALVGYHIVANRTVYSDMVYADGKAKEFSGPGHAVVEMETVEGREVWVDIEEGMRVNGFGRVVADLVARDGSSLMLERVLLPPQKVKGKSFSNKANEDKIGDLMERLDCVRGHEL